MEKEIQKQLLLSLNKKVSKYVDKDQIRNMRRHKVVKGISILEIDEGENKTRISDDIDLFDDLKNVKLPAK